MAVAARWIRLDPGGVPGLRAASAGFALAQSARAAPAVLWAGSAAGRIAFAVVAPLKFAPGRSRRWRSWALAPLIAAYRQFGLRAYLEGDGVFLSGREIAGSDAAAVGECAVVASSCLAQIPGLNDAFRGRIEAQHGWQFDHSWPTAAENEAITGAITGQPADAE